jgi:hypothetical protein
MNDAKYWDGCTSGMDLCRRSGFARESGVEAILETERETIHQFIRGLQESL